MNRCSDFRTFWFAPQPISSLAILSISFSCAAIITEESLSRLPDASGIVCGEPDIRALSALSQTTVSIDDIAIDGFRTSEDGSPVCAPAAPTSAEGRCEYGRILNFND